MACYCPGLSSRGCSLSVCLSAVQRSLPPGLAASGSAAAWHTSLALCLTHWEESGEAALGTGRLPGGVWPGCGRKHEALPPPGPWVPRASTQSSEERACWQRCWEHCQQAPELGMRHFPLAYCSPLSFLCTVISEKHWFHVRPAAEASCYFSSLFQRDLYGHEQLSPRPEVW